MEITEVRVYPQGSEDGKLRAYASVIFDNAFLVRDLRIIDGKKGLFAAMPSSRLRLPCPKCRYKNTVNNKFCSQCGQPLDLQSPSQEGSPEPRSEHRDIAHPITSEMREHIQKKVLEAYEERTQQAPGETTT